MSLVGCERRDGVAVVTLCNAPVNALSPALLAELTELFEALSEDDAVQAVILAAEGRVFSAGADVKPDATALPTQTRLRLVREGLGAVGDCRKPVIAAVNGPALGIGASLVTCCDIIYMTEAAALGFPEVSLGVVGGARHAMRLLPHSLLRRLFLSGGRVAAKELLARGVIEAVLPADELLPTSLALAREIAAKSPTATKLAKETLNAIELMSIRDGYRYEQFRLLDVSDTPDALEAKAAFREKRKPAF